MKTLSNKQLAMLAVAIMVVAMPELALAATKGEQFKTAYTFVYDAATGYLGRTIAIVGLIIGLGVGAAMGKALPAIVGIVLGMFGALGPAIINSIFGAGALI